MNNCVIIACCFGVSKLPVMFHGLELLMFIVLLFSFKYVPISWWRQDVETLSALLALCEGTPSVTCGFDSQKAKIADIWCFFDVSTSQSLNKNSSCRWSETPWRSFEFTVMITHCLSLYITSNHEMQKYRKYQSYCILVCLHYCPACRTTLIATRFWVVMICPIIKCLTILRVFFYFVWFVFIHHNFQFHFELCTHCNILDIYLS